MQKLAVILLLASGSAFSADFDVKGFLNKTYITLGVGYKIDELTIHFTDKRTGVKYDWNDPYSARIEMGYKVTNNLKFGLSHHSQWRTGFPFHGQKNEYYKTEIFVDYTITLGELLN